eukprot:6293834-Amphidinium_carterae.1
MNGRPWKKAMVEATQSAAHAPSCVEKGTLLCPLPCIWPAFKGRPLRSPHLGLRVRATSSKTLAQRFEPIISRLRSGRDTTTPCAHEFLESKMPFLKGFYRKLSFRGTKTVEDSTPQLASKSVCTCILNRRRFIRRGREESDLHRARLVGCWTSEPIHSLWRHLDFLDERGQALLDVGLQSTSTVHASDLSVHTHGSWANMVAQAAVGKCSTGGCGGNVNSTSLGGSLPRLDATFALLSQRGVWQ